MNITPEMVAALSTLRVATKSHSVPDSVKDAINLLDNADFFTPIDEARDTYESAGTSFAGGGLDRAEWGDTTRADMAARQGL